MLSNMEKVKNNVFKVDFLQSGEKNIFQVFKKVCLLNTDQEAITWLDKNGDNEHQFTFGEMLNRVRVVAHYLAKQTKTKKGDRVILCYPPGLDFLFAFWACISVGLIPVPVCPVDPFYLDSDNVRKLEAIVVNCKPVLFLTDLAYLTGIKTAQLLKAAPRDSPLNFDKHLWYPTDTLALTDNLEWDFSDSLSSKKDELCFLQYTSGSTGSAKGVMVTHQNLMVNSAMIMEVFTRNWKNATVGFLRQHTIFSWLPTFHDMGLIGFHIAPILAGARVAYMSPLHFINNPLNWLKVISRLKYVTTGAPCFALDLCVRRATPEFVKSLDLSGVAAIMLGASPIIHSSLDAFARTYAPSGFSPSSYLPSYGLAENVLLATANGTRSDFPKSIYVSQKDLQDGHIVVMRPPPSVLQEKKKTEKKKKKKKEEEEEEKDDDDEFESSSLEKKQKLHDGGRWLISSGRRDQLESKIVPDAGAVIIVDPNTRTECKDGKIGEIWICGPSKAQGYWENEEASTETFHGHLSGGIQGCVLDSTKRMAEKYPDFLRTGDMGFWHDSFFYICGRKKDMIIVNGVNYYATDVEEAVKRASPLIRPGCISAVSFTSPGEGYVEKMCVLLELYSKTSDKKRPVGELSLPMKVGLAAGVLYSKAPSLPPAVSSIVFTPIEKAIQGMSFLVGAMTARCKRKSKSSSLGYTEKEKEAIINAVRTHIMRSFGISLHTLVLLKPKTLHKTSSGKIRRQFNRSEWEKGKFDDRIIAESTPVGQTSFRSNLSPSSDVRTNETNNPNTANGGGGGDMDGVITYGECLSKVVGALVKELNITEMKTSRDKDGNVTYPDFDIDKTLDQYGMDSITASKLVEVLSEQIDIPLSIFMFISDPTARGIAENVVKIAKVHLLQNSQSKEASRDAISTAMSRKPALTGDHLPYIFGIGTAVPPISSEGIPGACGHPKTALPSICKHMELDKAGKKKLTTIFNGTGIECRHMVRKDGDELFFGRTGKGNDASIDERNDVFRREAPKLSLVAAKRCIADWKQDKMNISHVVAVTCTGCIVPGLEFSIMQDLELPADTQRLGIQFMGCFGAVSGMKMAKALAVEDKDNRVLLVCCELCSLHMQLSDKTDNLIATALFSDGAAAMIVGCGPRMGEKPLFAIHGSASEIIPNTLPMMAWDMSGTGMKIGLAKEISFEIYKTVEPFVARLFQYGYKANKGPIKDDQCCWAIHPGGPMIITSIINACKIDKKRTQASWDVLRDNGNMSSATLIFVLDHIRKSKANNQKNAWVPAIAFGPGLNIEGTLLRACF